MFLGELIKNNPDKKLFSVSKIPPKNMRWPAMPTDNYEDTYPKDHVLHYAKLIRKNLGVACIDLLQFHTWDDSFADNSDWHETVKHLKDAGIIKAFGISLNRWEMKNGIKAIKTGLVDVVQVIYNIFDQDPEDKLFSACKKFDVGIIARVPLDEGSLTGKMTLKTKFPDEDWRAKYFGPENLPPTISRIDKLKKIVPKSMTLPEMALRFVLSNKQVSTVIIGMRKKEHVRENIKVSDGLPLGKNLMRELRRHRWDRKKFKFAQWAN